MIIKQFNDDTILLDKNNDFMNPLSGIIRRLSIKEVTDFKIKNNLHHSVKYLKMKDIQKYNISYYEDNNINIIKKLNTYGKLELTKINDYFLPTFIQIPLNNGNINYYPVYNHLLNKIIWHKEQFVLEYIAKNTDLDVFYKNKDKASYILNCLIRKTSCYRIVPYIKWYPYQSIDMTEKGNVKFIQEHDIITHLDNRKIVEKMLSITDECTIALPSTIDLFKMKRNNDNNYKYLYQIDPRTRETIKYLENIAKTTCNNDNVFKVFVPYLPHIDVHHIQNTKNVKGFDVYNEQEFIKYLNNYINNNEITERDKGIIIYELDSLFRSYEDFNKSNIDDFIIADWERINGVNADQINGIINNFINGLRNLKKKYDSEIKNYSLPNDCSQLISNMYNNLGTSDTLVIDKKMEIIKDLCNYKLFNLDILLNHLETNIYTWDNCESLPLRTDDINTTLVSKKCDALYIDDKNVRSKLSAKYGINLGQNKMDSVILDEDYNPEFKKNIEENNYDAAFNNRQLILGDYFTKTEKIKDCSLIVKADPWIMIPGNIKDITWTYAINKIVMGCMGKNDMTFPIRIDMPNMDKLAMPNMDKLAMYIPFNPTNLLLIGSILIKAKGKRTNYKNRWHVQYIYFNKNTKELEMSNFRANKVVPGNLNDHVKVLYIELNVLKYFKDDLGIQLYFYKKNNTSTYLVSRKSWDELPNYHNSLTQVDLIKDDEKLFYFRDKNIQIGKGLDGAKYKYKLIKSAYNDNFSDGYPKALFADYLKSMDTIAQQYGDDFYYYDAIANPISTQAKNVYDKTDELWITNKLKIDKSNVSKYILSLKSHKIGNFLAYEFNSYISVIFFDIIHNFKLLHKNNKIQIIAKNGAMLDTILYYQKYVNYNFIGKDITVYLYDYDPKKDSGFAMGLIKNNKVSYDIYKKFPIEMDGKNKDKIDFGIVDINILIKELYYLRNNYSLHFIIQAIIVTLNNLNKGGNIYMYIPRITNKMTFNFYHALSQYFEEYHIHEPDIIKRDEFFCHLIYKNYKGSYNKEEFADINQQFINCDPSGGLNYQIENEKESDLFNINYKSSNPPKCYINNIYEMESDDEFEKYCKKMTFEYEKFMGHLLNINTLGQNKSLISSTIVDNIAYCIKYIKEIGLQTVEWIDDKGIDNFFTTVMINNMEKNTKAYIDKFNYKYDNIEIELYDKIKTYNEDYFDQIWKMSEDVYKYIEKIDKHSWKQPELFFNNIQKNLQRFLKDEYDVNINNRYVSRAWAKMQEILSLTKYFNNIEKDTVNALHICEAPGNFIASTLYYIEKNTKIKNYKYKAQSWKYGDIWDEFGFIKQTQQNWDFGKDKSGDITSYDNLKYYYDTYKGVDSIVGDCGIPWSVDKDMTKDLGLHQLIYAILLPRVGGNFIIKTFAINYHPMFLALMTVIAAKYTDLYIYRSGINAWSPEIYLVGINKKPITVKEEQNMLTIAENLSKGILSYPISELKPSLITEFQFHAQNIVNIYVTIKKFFVYLAKNKEEFNKMKPKLENILNKINIQWIKQYMPYLNKSIDKYIDYVKLPITI